MFLVPNLINCFEEMPIAQPLRVRNFELIHTHICAGNAISVMEVRYFCITWVSGETGYIEKREKYIQYPYLICSVKSLHSNITFKLQEESPSIEWLGKPGVSNKSAVTYLNGR